MILISKIPHLLLSWAAIFILLFVVAAATAVTLLRYSGRKHSLSDILVVGAIGCGIGRYVYRTRRVQPSDATGDAKQKKTTKLMPFIVPLYSPQTRTFGGMPAWNF